MKIETWEYELLTEMKKQKNWHLGEASPKLLYLYQRYVALPMGDNQAVQDIAKFCREKYLNKTTIDNK